jgi:hypothetical protein
MRRDCDFRPGYSFRLYGGVLLQHRPLPRSLIPDSVIYAGFRLRPVAEAEEGALIGLTPLNGRESYLPDWP